MLQPSRIAAALLSAVLSAGVWIGNAEAQAQTETQTETQTQPQSEVDQLPQTPIIGGPLAKIDVLQMTVAPLNDHARACGLDSGLIADSFQQPLTEKGLVVQKSAHVWIQLKATTLRYEGDMCITYIEARAVQNTRYFDRKTETERSGRVLLWSDGGLFVTGAANHGVTTNIGWRDLARRFVSRWEMDQ